MKKVLILCLHREGRSPSQRFRFEQYLSYLTKNGYSFDFSNLLNEKDDKIYYAPKNYTGKIKIVLKSITKRIQEVFAAKKYDLVFVQREAFMLGTAYFEKAISRKVPMIFDFDDSIWLQNISEANKNLAFLKDASKTSKIIKAARLVFAGNEFLANYARQYNKNVVIVPTTIDTDVYKKQEIIKDNRICIGWSGSFSTIEHFLTAVPALKRIKEKYRGAVKFMVIGDANFYNEELDIKGLPWKASTEIENLSHFDIGIMPLPDTEWAMGKCGLKGLQYMALGIPTLMSPIGVNKDIIKQGENGYLPNNEDEWVTNLSQLIESPELRKSIGEAGKRTVVENYSVAAWKNTYLKYFNQISE